MKQLIIYFCVILFAWSCKTTTSSSVVDPKSLGGSAEKSKTKALTLSGIDKEPLKYKDVEVELTGWYVESKAKCFFAKNGSNAITNDDWILKDAKGIGVYVSDGCPPMLESKPNAHVKIKAVIKVTDKNKFYLSYKSGIILKK